MAIAFREPNQVKWIGVRPGHNGVQVFEEAYTNANLEFYAVPADKLFLLFDWHLGVTGSAAGDAFLSIRDGVDAHYRYLALASGQAANPGGNTSQALWLPIEIATGFDFYVTTAVTCAAYIHGILIDA